MTRIGNVPTSTIQDTSNVIFADGEAPRKYAYGEIKKDILGSEPLYDPSLTPKGAINQINASLSENVQQQHILSLQNNSWGYKGICVRNWITGAFSSQYYKDKIDECIEKLNIDSVSIVPNTYQQNQTATNVEYRTPVSIDETRDFINYCKSKNLKIMLKPQVESDDGVWRATYNPSDVNLWFISYKTMILKWAQLAEDTKCEMFSIGSEYRSLTNDNYKQNWEDIINAVRSVYSGIILYASSCNATLGDEYETLSFWDLVDVIGLDNYLMPTTNTETPLEDYDILMQNNYQNQNIIQPIDFLAKKYNKPVIFSEYGISTTDDNYQSNYIESYFKNYGNYEWNRGMFLWVIDPENVQNNFQPIGRTAEATIKKYYSQYTKTQKIDYPKLFTTLSTTDSNTYWAKIANIKLVNYSTVEGCIELMQEQVNAGIGITLSDLKFRIYSDGMNYPVKVNLKLNQNAYVLPSQITYVITEDDVNYKNIDIYIKITQSVKYSFLLKTISEKKIITLFNKYPLLSVLPSGTQGNPSGNYILTGTLSGSMNSGIISQQVTLPNPVDITFVGATCTALNGGNTYDVNVNAEIVDNTHINITGKHISVNGNYGYSVKWVVIGN
ncbi:hypothetical protein CLSAB_19470 [Clostridium saccharobutylicum]|uniref:glycoside hydrolase family 113 n=1 Tax=Clostridium saccharobutylicum TaxID=169679 RepID=UPI00098BFA4F|nr:hypothetical protein [Clostridium saccharobutylicum]OOM17227.1 hypothetical protein CLSAB_19470 [Clostridium saccharobutylicum]